MQPAMPEKSNICAGCGSTFHGAPAELWCPECRPTVKPFTVELSATQRQQVESLATVRGVTPEEIVRQGIASLAGRHRLHRLTKTERELAESLRPSRRRNKMPE